MTKSSGARAMLWVILAPATLTVMAGAILGPIVPAIQSSLGVSESLAGSSSRLTARSSTASVLVAGLSASISPPRGWPEASRPRSTTDSPRGRADTRWSERRSSSGSARSRGGTLAGSALTAIPTVVAFGLGLVFPSAFAWIEALAPTDYLASTGYTGQFLSSVLFGLLVPPFGVRGVFGAAVTATLGVLALGIALSGRDVASGP